MANCPDPECKREIMAIVGRLCDNLYGQGPEGDKGVYGMLKKKVGWTAFSLFTGLALLIIGWIMIHESRISKNETVLQTVCTKLEKAEKSQDENTKRILDAISLLKR